MMTHKGHMLPHAVALIAGAVLLIGLGLRLPTDHSNNPNSGVWLETYETRRHREVGRWLAAHTPEGTRIASMAAGILPYYAKRPTIDILGLNDLVIARTPAAIGNGRTGHERWAPEYVLTQQPVIIPEHAMGYFDRYPLVYDLYQNARFDGPEGTAVDIYIRRLDWNMFSYKLPASR